MVKVYRNKMKINQKFNLGSIAFLIVILQVIAWMITVSPIFLNYSETDAAGYGMSVGFAFLFISVPAMIFIFASSLYLAFKNYWCKIIALINFLVLLTLFILILIN